MIEAQSLIITSTTLFVIAALFPFRYHNPPLLAALSIAFDSCERGCHGE